MHASGRRGFLGAVSVVKTSYLWLCIEARNLCATFGLFLSSKTSPALPHPSFSVFATLPQRLLCLINAVTDSMSWLCNWFHDIFLFVFFLILHRRKVCIYIYIFVFLHSIYTRLRINSAERTSLGSASFHGRVHKAEQIVLPSICMDLVILHMFWYIAINPLSLNAWLPRGKRYKAP